MHLGALTWAWLANMPGPSSSVTQQLLYTTHQPNWLERTAKGKQAVCSQALGLF